MLPAAFCSHGDWLMESARVQHRARELSGKMPDSSGNMPALPKRF
jgi:hypothetical protein